MSSKTYKAPMQMFKNLLFACTFPLFLIACYPRMVAQTPGVNGHIIDAITQQPIAGATIGNLKTDREGGFSFPPVYEMGIATPMGGIYPVQFSFYILAEGYDTLNCYCEALVNYPFCDNVTLLLQPSGSNSKAQQAGKAGGYGNTQCFPYKITHP
jgi:hypothetical protein